MIVKIHLSLQSTAQKSPVVLVRVNESDVPMVIASTNSEEVFEVDLPIGRHCLEFSLSNKVDSDTVVDSAGNIVEDLMCVISQVCIGTCEITDINSLTISESKTNGWISNCAPYKIFLIVPGEYFLSRQQVYASQPNLLRTPYVALR